MTKERDHASDVSAIKHAWRIEGAKVYWGISGKAIRGADATTFQVINEIWAMDGRRVFVYDRLLRGADAASFEVFNPLFARDKGRAYYSFGVIKSADAATFRAIGSGIRATIYQWTSYSGFAADKNSVFHYTQTIGKPSVLKGADPISFEWLGCDYGKDAERVYYRHTKVPKAISGTFHLLGLHHATDGKRVFYGNQLIDGAEAESFVENPKDPTMGNDRFRAYQWGREMMNSAQREMQQPR